MRKKAILVSFVTFSLLFLFLPLFSKAETIVSGNVTTDTIWTKAGSPYLIFSDIRVASGTELSLEPGTVVKMGFRTELIIEGKISALGTQSEKIVFTSYNDDSFGGDTDQNGFQSTIHPWKSITFKQGSVGNLMWS